MYPMLEGLRSLRREIVGGVEAGDLCFGYEEPNGIAPAIGLLGLVAMIAGESVAPLAPLAAPSAFSSRAVFDHWLAKPLAETAASYTFPSLARPLCRALHCALSNAPWGTVQRDKFTHGWTDTVRDRAEKIAEVHGPKAGEQFLREISYALSHLCRDRDELHMPLADLAVHLGVREDSAEAARDLLLRRDSFGASPVKLPGNGGSLPGKLGKHFALVSGIELDAPAKVPFPARAILIRALNGHQACIGYIRDLAYRAGFDGESAAASRALRHADKLHKLETWTRHYTSGIYTELDDSYGGA